MPRSALQVIRNSGLAFLAETPASRLTQRNAGSREELDQVEANRKKSEAQVQSSRASLEQSEADYLTNILGCEAKVASAKTAVRNTDIELSYCRMYAPIDGRISRVYLHVGNLVGESQSSLLATIVKIDSVYAYVNVSEYDPPQIPQQFQFAWPAGRRPRVNADGAWPRQRAGLSAPGPWRLSGPWR